MSVGIPVGKEIGTTHQLSQDTKVEPPLFPFPTEAIFILFSLREGKM